MATFTKAQLIEMLNRELNDYDNFTFSPEEKTYAIERAIADEDVYSNLDITLPVTGLRDYALDERVQAVYDIGLDKGDGFEGFVGSRFWRHRTGDNTLVIDRAGKGITSGSFVAQVAWKYQDTDNIPSYLVEYVLQLALMKIGDILSQTKVNRFLKNDTTMSELMAKINEATTRSNQLRTKIRHNESVRL